VIEKDAVISKDGKYRYQLTRRWSQVMPMVAFLLFNPSTADASTDDATIRKAMGFASRWDYGGIVVLNLFAYRSRNPDSLGYVDDPVGVDNDWTIMQALDDVSALICAWGCAQYMRSMERQQRKRALLHSIHKLHPGLAMQCLGMGVTGEPYHPLMLAYKTELCGYALP
jgi:hypothetical protein